MQYSAKPTSIVESKEFLFRRFEEYGQTTWMHLLIKYWVQPEILDITILIQHACIWNNFVLFGGCRISWVFSSWTLNFWMLPFFNILIILRNFNFFYFSPMFLSFIQLLTFVGSFHCSSSKSLSLYHVTVFMEFFLKKIFHNRLCSFIVQWPMIVCLSCQSMNEAKMQTTQQNCHNIPNRTWNSFQKQIENQMQEDEAISNEILT